ncbi:MAG: alpha-amylase family glycosyl hydrolase [Burkholderiaceae bacterium]
MLADDWWKHGIVYQIYPRSFQDSNADGIGDLDGIATRLDYLQGLGVDAIWISPIYPSPMADFGYDVADYCDVDPMFGTLVDFEALMADAHARGLKVILDYVPNHTSDQHPWFQLSRSARDNPKRDWYLWRDPAADGGPPNNWLSNFGGPAWTFDEATGQYYSHSFLKQQPDLNWRKADVRAAMYEVMRFWLRRGVDGFRIDVLYHVLKDAKFRDNPPNPNWQPGDESSHRVLPVRTTDLPEMQQIVREMRQVTDEFSTPQSSRILIGELYLPIERLVRYYGCNDGNTDGVLSGVQLPFNFHLIGAPWQAEAIGQLVQQYEAALPAGAAPNWVLGNHDKPRIASRVGADNARLAAMLLLTLRGTPTLYYGDEIGMQDVEIAPDEVQDPFEKNEPGKGLGRDPERTPMQWTPAAPHAGFTQGTPWLRLADDWRDRNVERQDAMPTSMLTLYRALIALRRAQAPLNRGDYERIEHEGLPADVLAYARSYEGRRLVVLLNFSEGMQTVGADRLPAGSTVLVSTHAVREEATIGISIDLRAFEGVVVGPRG